MRPEIHKFEVCFLGKASFFCGWSWACFQCCFAWSLKGWSVNQLAPKKTTLFCGWVWVNKPIAVHVSRPVEVEKKQKDLPIIMMEQEIMEAINEQSTVIICGETGCGKTTQVPQFLYEAGFGSKHSVVRNGVIGVTQPRRFAVLATARRVAFELGLHLGREVGFQVRHDKRIRDDCSIKFMTDGILLREVQVWIQLILLASYLWVF